MLVAIAEFERDKTGMGTTISAALVVGWSLVIGQVGDSRIYQIRAGTREQITEDHTLIAWQIKQGLISADEAKSSPHRNVITRAVGNREYVEVDTSSSPSSPATATCSAPTASTATSSPTRSPTSPRSAATRGAASSSGQRPRRPGQHHRAARRDRVTPPGGIPTCSRAFAPNPFAFVCVGAASIPQTKRKRRPSMPGRRNE